LFCFVLLFFVFVVLEFELGPYTLSHFTSPFLWQVFPDRISQTFWPCWLQTEILLISASWVFRITGVSTGAGML
jgi:hypothetical protein